jgi:hypothetical protein
LSSTSEYLGNFANAAGVSTGDEARMVWGVAVDADGDGFDGDDAMTPYKNTFALASGVTGVSLSYSTDETNSIPSDDVLFIAPGVMEKNLNAVDGSTVDMNRVLSLNMVYGGGVNAGDAFKIIWFDALAFTGTTTVGEIKYGMYALPSTLVSIPPLPANALPGDGVYLYGPASAGADPLKTM